METLNIRQQSDYFVGYLGVKKQASIAEISAAMDGSKGILFSSVPSKAIVRKIVHYLQCENPKKQGYAYPDTSAIWGGPWIVPCFTASPLEEARGHLLATPLKIENTITGLLNVCLETPLDPAPYLVLSDAVQDLGEWNKYYPNWKNELRTTAKQVAAYNKWKSNEFFDLDKSEQLLIPAFESILWMFAPRMKSPYRDLILLLEHFTY